MTTTTTFHNWLISQTALDNAVGDIARDYERSIASGLHDTLSSPDELRAVMLRVAGENSDVLNAMDAVESAWSSL